MELTGQSQITIQNKVFTLGSPVTHADTLNQLLTIFQEQGIEGRPIVVINPVEDSLPDLQNLLENYIENAMQGTLIQRRTTYMFQDATDDDILKWASDQYKPGAGITLDYFIETGKAIRAQSQTKVEIDKTKDRLAYLWQQHCLHPESDEGSAEYSNLNFQVLPQLEARLQEITKCMAEIPKTLDNGTVPVQQQEIVENPVEPVENHDAPIANVENPVESVESGLLKPNVFLFNPTNLLMPISVAKGLADSPQNAVFKQQQSQTVPGYQTVPLEYLIALGVQLYADGVPIVYTKSGEFRRVGDIQIPPVVSSYWYPKPRYATS